MLSEQSITTSKMLEKETPLSVSMRYWKWILIVFVSLWSPIIHFVRWSLAPEGYTYYFFHNHDLADWHYILKSADNNFLSIHDVEKDVPIWLRPDCHALLFFPFILVGKWFSLSSTTLLISADVLGNLFCAFATFFFFEKLLGDERKSLVAFCLVYFSSGIVGLIVMLRWLWLGDFGAALYGWVGENHSLGYDLMEGNMVHWTTIIFRPYYLFPRALGLISIAMLYDAYRSQEKYKLFFSAACLFLASLIHPQSGLIYGAMAIILTLMQATKQGSNLFHRIQPALWTISGLIAAGILWKLYQQIPDVNEAAKEYMKRMYNADSVPLLFAMMPMLVPIAMWTAVQTKEKAFTFLLIVSVTIYSIAVSEWIIREKSVGLRVLLLALAFSGALLAIVWKRNYVFSLLRSDTPKVYLGLCAFVVPIVALSPHHDGLKVLPELERTFGNFAIAVAPFLKTLSLIYAAPFRLGIAVSLAGLLALLAFDFPMRLRYLTLIGIFSVSAISIAIYLFLLFSSKVGYLKNEEREAMLFLRGLSGKNVMCAGSSQFIIQIAQKRTLIGGVAGVLNLDERREDIASFFSTDDISLRQSILRKYNMDYIYLGEEEKKLLSDETALGGFRVLFHNKSAKIFEGQKESSLDTR